MPQAGVYTFDEPGRFQERFRGADHAMVVCLAGQEPDAARRCGGSHAHVMTRFEDFLVARRFEPLYLAEICAAIGVSERTLRTCCQEHLGMAPIRYLWLRRMHLARRALLRAGPETTTVTEIATEHGFWELGRFSVEYRALFGESPSASLRWASARPDALPSPIARCSARRRRPPCSVGRSSFAESA
jgi:AraC-like DNA-binding protein